MTELKSAECHGHPALDVRWQEDERAVFDNELEVGVEEFKDQVEIFL